MPPDDPIDLKAIVELGAEPKAPDLKTIAEETDLERQRRAALVRGLEQDIAERKKYAGRIFCLISLWLIGIFTLLLFEGFLSSRQWFHLSDAVLMAAIGGTTLNVIGIFIVVARYLFPQRTDY